MNDNNPSNDYATPEERRILTALQNLNIGANGRWFMLALVAIAISAGQLKLAVCYAILLGSSVILEQASAPWRPFLAYALYAWGAIGAVWLLVIV